MFCTGWSVVEIPRCCRPNSTVLLSVELARPRKNFFYVFVGGVTNRLQDVHHGAHQLVCVSVRDEILHLFVSRHVGCHAEAQREVTCHPLRLLAVRRKSCGVEPTLEVKGGLVRIVPQRIGDSNVLVVQTFEHRRSLMVHASGIYSMHTSRARALVSVQLRCIFPQTLAALSAAIGVAVHLNVFLYTKNVSRED